MIDDAFILKVERLRDSVEELRKAIRATSGNVTSQVGSNKIKEDARSLAEVWMVEIAETPEVRTAVDPEVLANHNIGFQRLLTLSERRSQRKQYEAAFRAILKDFRPNVVIPLKQLRGSTDISDLPSRPQPTEAHNAQSAFVAHSFAEEDARVVNTVKRFLELRGVRVITGERPKADLVSAKVRGRIEEADLFVGIFSRRDKLSGRDEWVTSTWLIDEKALAFALRKKLILLKERGVSSIGGLQGDWEYIQYSVDELDLLLFALMELFADL